MNLSLVLFLELGVARFLDTLHALLDFCPQREVARGEVGVSEVAHLRLECVDSFYERLNALNVALVLRANKARDDAVDYAITSVSCYVRLWLAGKAARDDIVGVVLAIPRAK